MLVSGDDHDLRVADALLGNFRTYSEFASDPLGLFRFWQAEGYVSDNWKVSQKLSVEAGVRYTWHSPMYTQANNMANFDPSLYDPARAVTILPNGTLVAGSGNPYNGMIRPGEGVPERELGRVPNGNSPSVLAVPAGAPRGFYENQNLFGPRFSFAWSPSGKGNTAVRGGIGLYFDRPEGNLLFGGTGNGPVNSPPYVVSSQYENGSLTAPGGGSVPAPAPIGTISAMDAKAKVPSVWNWSLSYQRELPWGFFGELAYVGAKGQNLYRQPDINQVPFAANAANQLLPAAQRVNNNFLRPYKGYTTIAMHVTDADSKYNALQVYLSKRRGRLTATVSYTLSYARDNASGNNDDPEEYTNKDYNWGPSSIDRRHIVVTTWTWKLPFFKSERGVGRVLGGWEISGIGRHQSGSPLLFITGNTSTGSRRADSVGGDLYVADAQRFGTGVGVVQWLNPAAFAAAPDSRRGNSTKGMVTGPGYDILDIAFRKGFRISRDVRLSFQADLFNALNHTNFTTVSTNLANADFGRITATAPPRNVQLAVRLQF